MQSGICHFLWIYRVPAMPDLQYDMLLVHLTLFQA
jgi:hypothetical protein